MPKNKPFEQTHKNSNQNNEESKAPKTKKQPFKIKKPFDDDKWHVASKHGKPIKLTDKVSIVAFKCPLDPKYDVWIEEKERHTC